jgi:hypothetical protein
MAGQLRAWSNVEELERDWEWDHGDPEELFVLEEEIASGSFGSVYKARHDLEYISPTSFPKNDILSGARQT